MKINTFVIPHLNYSGLKRTLSSIRRNTPENFNIILIDQNEKYQDVDDLVDLHIYTNGTNLGFAKASNLGIRLADTKYVSVWNDDAECINAKWWDGIMLAFERFPRAVGINPASPRNPRAAGDIPINQEGFDYKPNLPDKEYDDLIAEGQGNTIDGICTFATVFLRERLDKIAGVIPGKCWFDELFYPGGGEDYDLNRRAFMTRSPENDHLGYRMLGTKMSYIYHWWYKTKHPKTGKAGVKHCGTTYHDKWGVDADLFGHKGKLTIPTNIIRPLEDCK